MDALLLKVVMVTFEGLMVVVVVNLPTQYWVLTPSLPDREDLIARTKKLVVSPIQRTLFAAQSCELRGRSVASVRKRAIHNFLEL